MPKNRPVSEALAHNKPALEELVYGGQDHTFAGLPTLVLPDPIKYRKKTYEFLSVERFQTGESFDKHTGILPFSPALSLMLLEQDGPKGLVTRINYASFGLSRSHLRTDPHMPRIDGILVPEAFSVSYNGHFDDPEPEHQYRTGMLGSEAESGVAALIAAETIEATGELVRHIGFEALGGMLTEQP